MREDIIAYSEASRYVAPKEPEVIKKLNWFQDQKLGFMVHWGTYSQLGMCESWPLSDGDAYWAMQAYKWEPNREKFRAQYFAMNKTFNPIRFNEDEWADFAAEAGFRYFIFTTKHHDGFCMYDTKYSDYKITAPDCPFHDNPRANVAKRLFDAFRKKGIAITPYFSKPDWHCPWYWAPGCEKPVAYDRNPTYNPKERPDLWQKYIEFTHAQLMELVEDLGPVEALWLDGGQVNPENNQDVRLDLLAEKARKVNPGLMFVDRTVGGLYENYVTPEQTVPKALLPVPWESCVSIGNGFAYSYDDDYKSPKALVKLLIDVVTRGGNLALNLGAQPDGRLPRNGMKSALGLGEWLRDCGEAIFSTRAVEPNLPQGEFGFTQNAAAVYALRSGAIENTEILIPWDKPVAGVQLIPEQINLEHTQTSAGVSVKIPEQLVNDGRHALVVKLIK